MQSIIDKCSCGPSRVVKMSNRARDAQPVTSLTRKLDTGNSGSPVRNEYTKPAHIIAAVTSGGMKEVGPGSAMTSRNKVNNARNLQQHTVENNALRSVLPPGGENGGSVDGVSEKELIKKLQQHQTNSTSDSNYTALNYDANYVRVSPPKMRRRLKQPDGRPDSSETKLTRGAQLEAAHRVSAALDAAGSLPLNRKLIREPRAPAPGPSTSERLSPEGDENGSNITDSGNGWRSVTSSPPDVQEVVILTGRGATNVPVRSPTNSSVSESDYMSLSDLQNRLSESMTSQSSDDVKSLEATEECSRSAGSQLKTLTATDIKTSVFKDGGSSFLKLTFTVKLDNGDVIKPSLAVISGTVNISKMSRDSSDDDITEPVISIGLQESGVMVTQEDDRACVTSSYDDVDGAITKESLPVDDVTNESRVAEEDGVYHCLLASERETVATGVKRVYEGFHQKNKDDETIHMSWDEVMKEAKNLGIPLSLPAAISNVQCKNCESSESSSKNKNKPKSTIAHLVDETGHVAVRLEPDSSACSQCPKAASHSVPQPQPTPTSPFRFRLCNLFGRRFSSKADEPSKLQAVSGTPEDVCSRSLPRNSPRRHPQQQSNASQLLRTQTLPMRSSERHKSATMVTSPVLGVSPRVLRHSPRSSSTTRNDSSRRRTTEVTQPVRDDRSEDVVDGMMLRQSSLCRQPTKKIADDVTVSCVSTMTRCSKGVKFNGDFISSLQQLHKQAWYWGAMGFEEAECRLSGLPDGSFLVRDSSDDRYILSLSFRSQGATHHTRIEHYSGMFSFHSQKNGHESSNIVDFINNAVVLSQAGYCLYYLRPRSLGHAPTPVRLLHPVNRRPASLLELTRTVVQRHVLSQANKAAAYDKLPVPAELRDYLGLNDHV